MSEFGCAADLGTEEPRSFDLTVTTANLPIGYVYGAVVPVGTCMC